LTFDFFFLGVTVQFIYQYEVFHGFRVKHLCNLVHLTREEIR
jgi:hypothetical protein